MKALNLVVTLGALALAGVLPAQAQLPRVRIHTVLGEIVAAIDTISAPVTAANFLRYVDAGMYAGGASIAR